MAYTKSIYFIDIDETFSCIGSQLQKNIANFLKFSVKHLSEIMTKAYIW